MIVIRSVAQFRARSRADTGRATTIRITDRIVSGRISRKISERLLPQNSDIGSIIEVNLLALAC